MGCSRSPGESVRPFLKQIFDLDLEGYTAKEIADRLVINPVTVSHCLNGHVYANLTVELRERRERAYKAHYRRFVKEYLKRNIDVIFELDKYISAQKIASIFQCNYDTIYRILRGRLHKDKTVSLARKRPLRLGRNRTVQESA